MISGKIENKELVLDMATKLAPAQTRPPPPRI